ncbi:two-component system response regulator PhoP [Yoonia maricola]|uniref:Two-component system response regulator PhoP n=1 Tax=Yoonia maricola TaxID=420999 RepID=A0A2M8W099_9RHOB|nr:response regulator [Yoonia maricola]PJI84351.1 two-component system response regulator PhoP [Yoonia maricola]
MKLLVVEDSRILRESLALGLRGAGYLVDVSADGEDALWRAEAAIYDVVVLDLGLPKRDGLSVLAEMRAQGIATPVLILTARDGVDDRVKGLRSGADDYLVKPFAFDELLARLEALTRRSNGIAKNVLHIDGLMINLADKTVTINDVPVALVRREYALLELLCLKAGTVVSRADIEAKIYDEHVEPNSNVVDAAVSILRKAIDPPDGPSRIETKRGQGYRLRRA